MLCLGVQFWARRLPRTLVIGSYGSIAIEVVAMFAYDGIGVFNLTVFEIVAFTLVFAWLIALVTITHATPGAGCRGPAATSSRSPARPPSSRAPSPAWSTRRRGRALAVVRRDASLPPPSPPPGAHRFVPRRPPRAAQGRRGRRLVRRDGVGLDGRMRSARELAAGDGARHPLG